MKPSIDNIKGAKYQHIRPVVQAAMAQQYAANMLLQEKRSTATAAYSRKLGNAADKSSLVACGAMLLCALHQACVYLAPDFLPACLCTDAVNTLTMVGFFIVAAMVVVLQVTYFALDLAADKIDEDAETLAKSFVTFAENVKAFSRVVDSEVSACKRERARKV